MQFTSKERERERERESIDDVRDYNNAAMSCILCCSALFPSAIGAEISRVSLVLWCPFRRVYSSTKTHKFCGSDFAPSLHRAHLTHCRRCWWGGKGAVCCDRGLSSEEHHKDANFISDQYSELQPAVSKKLKKSSSIPANDNQKQSSEGCEAEFDNPSEKQRAGTDFTSLLKRFWKVAAPYWSSDAKIEARMRLAGVLALTLATTGISVGFNLLGRDFYNALASKDQEQFVKQLLYYLGAFIGGIPVFVIRDFNRETLALHWRAWMTRHYMQQYFQNRTFYNIQSQSLIDNPDQRIVDDINAFASTSIGLAMALFNATIDLISFSGILFGIYPPLFAVLVIYSIGGTLISVALGKGLINLNFMQEKREADFRYGLVRVRENAESIAFYGGEGSELQLLLDRFKQSFLNYSQLLVNQRNLDFFTSGYRYLIQLLPAAVVAPLYFAGKIEFGVINQSFSAFNHVLSDFSIIVYQFQSISAFSAVVERLGEFSDVLEQQNLSFESSSDKISCSDANEALCVLQPRISILNVKQFVNVHVGEHEKGEKGPLLKIDNLTLQTPQYTATLVKNLSLVVNEGEHLLIMGPSGTGKTSLLRAIAGLWQAGKGTIKCYLRCEKKDGVDSLERFEDGLETNGVVRVASADERINARESAEEVKQNRDSCVANDVVSNSAAGHDIATAQMLFFLPQRPYLVLGTLRQQILYPTWNEESVSSLFSPVNHDSLPFYFGSASTESLSHQRPQPSDKDLIDVLWRVSLGHLLKYCNGLDSKVEWTNVLSLGEQQRLAFARLLVSKPRLVLLDESTSSLDEENEALLYRELLAAGITYISVGHRSSLRQFHSHLLTLTPSDDDADHKNWLYVSMKKQEEESTLLGSAN